MYGGPIHLGEGRNSTPPQGCPYCGEMYPHVEVEINPDDNNFYVFMFIVIGLSVLFWSLVHFEVIEIDMWEYLDDIMKQIDFREV